MKGGSQSRSERQNVSLLHAVAGALSGCVSRLVVAPLDVVKIRFQVQLEPIRETVVHHGHYTGIAQAMKTIVKEEGYAGLWRGTVPGLLLTVPYTAVQFVTIQKCKQIARESRWTDRRDLDTVISFFSGAVAGAAATLASYPFDLLRTTLAAQGEPKIYRGMMDAARGIVSEGGVGGLYRGFRITLIEIMPYSAIQFATYDWLNKVVDGGGRGGEGRSRSGFQTFTCGLLAGIASKLATHPLDVAKKRYQVAGLRRSSRYGRNVSTSSVRNLMACFSQIVREEGFAGLWKGCAPNLAKAGPAAAVTFLSYEFILGYLTSNSLRF